MTDAEFDILDELYFLQSYSTLQKAVKLPDEGLLPELKNLIAKEWVKCYESVNKEPIAEEVDFEKNYKKYYYLATKAGLLAHNTQ